MINISSIKQEMYCPMKLYIQTYEDNNENDEYQIPVEIKKLKIDVQDLIQKNMRKLKKDMTIDEVENVLSNHIPSYVDTSIESIKSLNLELDDDKINELYDETYFNIKIKSLRAKQAMEILNKNGAGIVDMFFPNAMYSYLLKDENLDLIGQCDKIEIIDGKYYPVLLKSSNPPIKGVWDQDAIELVANAILIEEEFDTEIFVGFVHYQKIAEKRPVIMDVELRKKLFNKINDVKEIVYNKKLPQVQINNRKCNCCEYKNYCIKD